MSITGIVWIGPLLDRGGYGNVSRNFVKGLHRAGFPTRTFNLGPEHAEVEPAAADLVRRLVTADVGPRPMAVVNHLPEMLRSVRVSGVARTACFSEPHPRVVERELPRVRRGVGPERLQPRDLPRRGRPRGEAREGPVRDRHRGVRTER